MRQETRKLGTPPSFLVSWTNGIWDTGKCKPLDGFSRFASNQRAMLIHSVSLLTASGYYALNRSPGDFHDPEGPAERRVLSGYLPTYFDLPSTTTAVIQFGGIFLVGESGSKAVGRVVGAPGVPLKVHYLQSVIVVLGVGAGGRRSFSSLSRSDQGQRAFAHWCFPRVPPRSQHSAQVIPGDSVSVCFVRSC